MDILNKLKEKINIKAMAIGAASFMLPMLALGIIFACYGVHPFGDKQIIVTDFWHQYYPFLCELQETLKSFGSLLYSKDIGMGVNFLALIAYYCASPLNILTVLVPKEALRDLVTFIVVLKIGFSGFFFSAYLRRVFNRNDFSVVAFSSLYALCGYVLGYYWNIMWLDCVALLPLVMLGVYCLVKENKWKLYVFALALAVITNFYIGYMVCIFTAIYFFAECIKQSVRWKDFFKKLLLIALTSVLALALTAFITIPAYNALGDTVSRVPKATTQESGFDLVDNVKEFAKDFPDVAGRLASFNQPVPKEGLPNIFSGFISVILLGFFLGSKNIKTREKLVTAGMIMLLFMSLCINDIDMVWHGMHKPNMVPYRYAFIMSFVLITMAYRAFTVTIDHDSNTKESKVTQALMYAVSVLTGVLVVMCAIKEAHIATVLGCVSLGLIYGVVILLCRGERNAKQRKAWASVLCGIIVAEVIINTIIAVPVVRTTVYSTYYYRGEEIERLVDAVEEENEYGRIETAQEYILNDPALFGYRGVSTFTSTANYPVTKLMEKLAICAPARANRYYYETTSPLTNGFLKVDYVIYKNNMKNLNPYLELVSTEMTKDGKYANTIHKNTQSLPLGFMAEESLLDTLEGENPFDVQNDLFRKATGLEGDLFTRIPLKSVSAETTIKVKGGDDGKYTLTLEEGASEKRLDINYVVPDTNSVYAYIDCGKVDKLSVSSVSYKAAKRKYIFPAGKYDADEKITFKFTMASSFKGSTNMNFHVYSMNEELFEEGMDLLRDEAFEITRFDDTVVEGKINAKKDGVFYTSIPYEDGWTLYVDGKKTTITPFEEAMVAVKLDKGEHEIALEYSPEGFKLGSVISVSALIVFIGFVIFTGKGKKKNGQDIGDSSVL